MRFEQTEEEIGPSVELLSQEENVFMLIKKESRDKKILEQFTRDQQKEILEKQKILSSLAYFIGKDFQIPVELNESGKGWHWDFKNNIIRIDPKDLLEKPMDYLRFVISHEGGHRRISRTDFIPVEIWRQTGFSSLMNAIEDPRDNNFVASNYPRFAEQMKLAYELMIEEEKNENEKAKGNLGHQLRFKQAGWEFIKLWFKERMKKPLEISADLPDEIKEIVKKTMVPASDAWNVYPTKELADKGGILPSGEKIDGEEMIKEYAEQSYEIILEEIWPEFKKLVEKDLEDQKMSELLKDLQKVEQGESGEEKGSKDGEKEDGESGGGLPKELKDKLSSEEQKELEIAIEKAIEEVKKNVEKKEKAGEKQDEQDVGKPKSIDMDSLSPSLKKKIQDYIDSLSEEKKKELSEKAGKALKDFEKEIEKETEGKLTENPEEREKREKKEEEEKKSKKDSIDKENPENKADKEILEEKRKQKIKEESEKMLEKVRKSLEDGEDEYQKEMKRLAPQINSLKEKLAEIFQERRKRGIRTGFEEGEEIDVERRLQEKAKGVSIFESKAWRRTELPREKDYAISLLVDLSGSMNGEKINEAFETTILFTEVLNSLGIKTEILGFNNRLYEYQKFNDKLSSDIRKKIITMKGQVDLSGSEDNDDGWAVTETSKRLKVRKEKEKLLLVISDGEPDNSSGHDGPEYELGTVVEKIIKDGEIKIVGLGLGSSGVSAVKQFYPKHLLANSAEEMIERIGDLLLEVIKG
jgi:hypothetical protein